MYQEYLYELRNSIHPLSTEELKDLLNDDEKLEEKVDQVLETLKGQKDNLFEENRTKAESNIEKEPQIIELKAKVAQLAEEGKAHCDAIQEKLAKIKGNPSATQETALALLQTAAAESEEMSEDLVKKFTENDLMVDNFLEEFLSARKTMHMRKLKAEKMQELMKRQSTTNPNSRRGNDNSPYGNLPSSGFFQTPRPYSGSNAPYPLGPVPLPMPRPY